MRPKQSLGPDVVSKLTTWFRLYICSRGTARPSGGRRFRPPNGNTLGRRHFVHTFERRDRGGAGLAQHVIRCHPPVDIQAAGSVTDAIGQHDCSIVLRWQSSAMLPSLPPVWASHLAIKGLLFTRMLRCALIHPAETTNTEDASFNMFGGHYIIGNGVGLNVGDIRCSCRRHNNEWRRRVYNLCRKLSYDETKVHSTMRTDYYGFEAVSERDACVRHTHRPCGTRDCTIVVE